MSSWSERDLIGALERAPLPETPPVDALLARAFPEELERKPEPRVHRFAFAAAAVAIASLPLVLPSFESSKRWNEGLVRRGTEWSVAVIRTLRQE